MREGGSAAGSRRRPAAPFLLGCILIAAAAGAARGDEKPDPAAPAAAHGDGKPDAAAAAKGKDLYDIHCAGCHGPDMVNPGTVSYDLRRFPRDARNRFTGSVLNGKPPGMPAWRGVVAPEEVDLLWAYVLTGGHL